MMEPESGRYRFDDFVLDARSLRLTASGEISPLEPKSFRLLQFLIENRDRAVPKDEIVAAVWPGTFVSDNSITRAITQIRKTLKDDAKTPKYIETVQTVGYRFIGKCHELEATSSGFVAESAGYKGSGEFAAIQKEKQRTPTSLAPWLIVTAVVLMAIATIVYLRKSSSIDAPEMRVEIDTPATSDPRSFALSPDGRQLAYVATSNGASQLWVRQLSSTKAQPLAVTKGGAAYPFWSPDSRFIGYFSGGELKRINSGGGATQTVTAAESGRGGTWNQDGVILFAPNPASPLFRVQASGGAATQLTKLEPWSNNHRFPQFLPDGKHYLFFEESSPELPRSNATGYICLGVLDSGEYKRLTLADTAGSYLPLGWMLWVRSGTLVAQRLDTGKGQLSGEALAVADPVFFDTSHARLFSVSITGLISYRNGTPTSHLLWFDRTGRMLGALAESADSDGYSPSEPRISPDGHRVAVNRTLHDQHDIWIMDDSHASRFTFGRGGFPVWSPDSRQIAFGGGLAIYLKPADGAKKEELVTMAEPRQGFRVDDWSPNGRFLIYETASQKTGYDLWIVPMDGNHKPRPFLQSKFDEKYARFSPDGHWVAYVSTETGRAEVYVRAFADPASSGTLADNASGVFQLSDDGGLFPVWHHDGKELYWVAPGGRIMGATITFHGGSLEPGKPVALFQSLIFGSGLDVNTAGQEFDVSPDGRFLINTMVKDTAATAITLLQNWNPK